VVRMCLLLCCPPPRAWDPRARLLCHSSWFFVQHTQQELLFHFPPVSYIIPNFGKPIALLVTCFTLVSCLAYSSTLKMEVTCFSETSVDFQRTTQLYIPENRILLSLCRMLIPVRGVQVLVFSFPPSLISE
jgi:hypothetical protein